MKIPSLEELGEYVSSVNLKAPKFEINATQVKIVARSVNYNIITDVIMLAFCVIIIQRVDELNAVIPVILLLLMAYTLWYDYNAVNTVQINFESDQILVKYRSPFRLLPVFLYKQRMKAIKISSLNGFFYKDTAQSLSFRRFRLYAEVRDNPDILLIDFPTEEHAGKVVDYLNKAMNEAVKCSSFLALPEDNSLGQADT